MTQHSFPITTRKPRIVITHLEGNLVVRSWDKQEISVEANGELNGLQQEGDTLTITGCTGDLTLWIPAIKNYIFPTITSITASDVRRNATIEGAGNVELRDVGGNATLENIYGNAELVNVSEIAHITALGGNLRAAHLPKLLAQKGIGGNVTLLDTRQAEFDAIGGNLAVTGAQEVVSNLVGGNLDVEQVETLLRCHKVGGNCEVHNSSGAEIRIDIVGGNLQCQGVSRTHSSLVGGNLRLQNGAPFEGHTHFHVGGNAFIDLPENANLTIHALVGGNVSGPATIKRGGGFVNLIYGEGAARLDVHAGGNLHLSGPSTPQSSSTGWSWDDFSREMADFTSSMSGVGHEMGKVGREIGREMEKVGREISREFKRAFRD
ncbi:MAG TPA: hypothetical protein VKR06_39730 [Ktedonosporobacter sp.]|nr:hypothetical protein [Ktedonosporobacter sp.]